MTKRFTLNALVVLTAVGILFAGTYLLTSKHAVSGWEGTGMITASEDDAPGETIDEAQKWLRERKARADGTLPLEDVQQAMQQVLKHPNTQMAKQSSLEWMNLGPVNAGGRTRALLVDHRNTDRIWAGGVAGGLWVSENKGNDWERVKSFDEFLTVSCITQSSNGDIYVGTGEGYAATNDFNSGSGGANSGHIGNGIYKLTDGEGAFEHLEATEAAPNQFGERWARVYDVAVHVKKPNRVYAATHSGLMMSENGGDTWQPATEPSTLIAQSVSVGPNGYVYATIDRRFFRSVNGDPGSFINKTDDIPDYAFNQASRLDVTTAPSNADYVYLAAIDNTSEGAVGCLYNIYQSKDQGESWTIIGPGGTSEFEPHGTLNGVGDRVHCQGRYNNVIAVAPDKEDRIFLGGQLFFYDWQEGNGWEKKATGFSPKPFRMHVDYHSIAFHPNNPDIMYIGNDGGIYRSKDQGETFVEINKNYVTTQFYGLGVSKTHGYVGGGTQDNGTQYMDYQSANHYKGARHVLGGDGGYFAVSSIHPNIVFAESQNGALRRGNSGGSAVTQCFYDCNIIEPELIPGSNPPFYECGCVLQNTLNGASFVMPFHLWEDPEAEPEDTLLIPRLHTAENGSRPAVPESWMKDTLVYLDTLEYSYDTILINDTVFIYFEKRPLLEKPNMFYAGPDALWVTLQAIDFATQSIWYRVDKGNVLGAGTVQAIDVTADGNTAFVGMSNGRVVRLTGLRDAQYGYTHIMNKGPCYPDTIIDGTDTTIITREEVVSQVPVFNDQDDVQAYNYFLTDEVDGSNNCDFDPDQVGIEATQVFNTGWVTGVAIDPNDPNNVVVTRGRYGNTEYVYHSTNAMDPTPTFTAIQGDPNNGGLPQMPTYDAVIDYQDSNTIHVATEFGVWTTTNPDGSNTEWFNYKGKGMERVPTFQIEQIPHPFNDDEYPIFVSTHGRGFYAAGFDPCKHYNCKTDIESRGQFKKTTGVLIYPNPMQSHAFISLDLQEGADVEIAVFNIEGQLVEHMEMQDQLAGKQKYRLNAGNLPTGLYIVKTEIDGETYTNKVVVTR